MNEISLRRHDPKTTQAAEGLPRWRWTTAELLALAETGIFTAENPFELIGGEIVPMSAQGRRHEVLREDLERYHRKRETAEALVIAEPQLNLDEATYTKPDIMVRPAAIRSPNVRGDTALLLIEISDSSLSYDVGTKANLYANYGVRDYWVINARTQETKIHRQPTPKGYDDVVKLCRTDLLTPLLAPALAVRLADLDLE